jgi:uncharacterized lipoprotein YmbA
MKKALLTAVVLGLAACASTPHTEPTRLLLSYDGAAPIASTAKATLVVRAVTVPDYLDRRNLVYRSGAELKEYPDAQWAERPAKAITRYLTQALSAQRSDYAVQALTTASGVAPDAALTLVIDRFEAEQGGTVQLRGSWTLTAPGKILASGRLDADATTSPTSASTTVAAMQPIAMQAPRF